MKNNIKTAPHLDPFLLDDCIEQFNRTNWPDYDGVEYELFLRLLKAWLVELRELREVNGILSAKIKWLGRKINDLEFDIKSK